MAADGSAVPAPHRMWPPPAEASSHRGALRGVLTVSLAVRAVLYCLGRSIDGQAQVAGDRGERGEELCGGVDGVEQLAPAAPACRRPLLEDADRVPVAVREVLQVGLLQGCGVGNGNRAHWHRAMCGDACDGSGDAGLRRVERDVE